MLNPPADTAPCTVPDMPTVAASFVIRTIASSLCFDQEPPPIKQLDKARHAAADITRALADAGIITLDDGPIAEFGPATDEPPLPLQVS
jgi:hypothetical protein